MESKIVGTQSSVNSEVIDALIESGNQVVAIDDTPSNVNPEDAYSKFSLKEMINPARYSEEPYESYKLRRKSVNKAIKARLKNGAVFHQSITYHEVEVPDTSILLADGTNPTKTEYRVKKHTYRKEK